MGGDSSSPRDRGRIGGCRDTYHDFHRSRTPAYLTPIRHESPRVVARCIGCDNEIYEGDRFCSACGPPSIYKCRSCRNQVFCPNTLCSSCFARELREREEQRRREEERRAAERRREEQRAMDAANAEFETERSRTSNRNNYIHITNDCERETRKLIQPSRFNNKWAAVEHELKLIYQHKKVNNKRVYVWKNCKIKCIAKAHVIFDYDDTNWSSPKDSTCNSFNVIYQALEKKECAECRKEIDAVKEKIRQFDTKQDNILAALKESKPEQENIKLSQIAKLEIDINQPFTECKEAIKNVQNIVSDSKRIAAEEEGNKTYETQIDLDKFTKKALKKQNEIAKQKQNVFRLNKKLDDKKNAVMKQENEINDQIIAENANKLELNEQYAAVDKVKSELGAIMENKSSADIAGDAIQRLNRLINKLLILLHEKYAANEQRMEELNQCKLRIGVIHEKLNKQKQENKYLVQLLNEEYDRLNTATQSAMKKFEENGIYFLSVTVGLKEDIIDRFAESGCDKLDDIKDMNEEDLIEIGIESKMMRKKILRHIKLLNEKFTENDHMNDK